MLVLPKPQGIALQRRGCFYNTAEKGIHLRGMMIGVLVRSYTSLADVYLHVMFETG